MKKAIFLVVVAIYSSTCFGQKIVLTNSVSTTIPTGSKKLSKTDISSFAVQKYKGDKIAIDAANNADSAHAFIIDNVLVSFTTENAKVEEGHLLKLKKGLDEMSKKDKSYTSIIKTINNNQILIINQLWGNVGYYRFFTFNNVNSSAIAGFLEYTKPDHTKATGILDNILQNIKFAQQ